MEKHKIKNLLQKLNDEDRDTLQRVDNVFRGIWGGGD